MHDTAPNSDQEENSSEAEPVSPDRANLEMEVYAEQPQSPGEDLSASKHMVIN